MPKVSIIVPCWGVEKYLDRCVESLINQTLKDIEIILVDDESPDLVPEMCDEWAKKDSRIKVVHKKNGGLGFARNSGIEVATGEYLAYMDSDDYIKLDAMQMLYDKATEQNADVVYGWHYKETAPGVWHDSKRILTEQRFVDSDVVRFMLDMVAGAPGEPQERLHEMSSCMSIYRRSILADNNVRFRSERVCLSEDLIYNIDFLKNAKKVVVIPYTYYYYCLNATSLTQTFKVNEYERIKNMRPVIAEALCEHDKKHERLNRFFIGYVRGYINHLADVDIKGKLDIVKMVINDPVWKEVSNDYKPSYLPLMPSVMYKLTIKGHPHMVLVVAKLVSILKKINSKL